MNCPSERLGRWQTCILLNPHSLTVGEPEHYAHPLIQGGEGGSTARN
jgi:hypothetical protein